MDDLASKINEIMSDPEKLREIQNLGKMMGLAGNSEDNLQSPGNGNNFNSTNNQSNTVTQKGSNAVGSGNPLSGLGGIDPGVIGKLAPILSSLNKEDETTRLFDALAPFLSAERQEKLQKIRKMMVIIKLLPNIKNLGLF